jgi:hypothetical protein
MKKVSIEILALDFLPSLLLARSFQSSAHATTPERLSFCGAAKKVSLKFLSIEGRSS